jgi:alpha-tubulin suppressor-like RCC1 family protein
MSLTFTAAVRANKPKRNVGVIAVGEYSSFALQKNGRAWAWGSNSYGFLGNNTTIPTATPISIVGATKTFCKISGGARTTSAIDKNGRAWAWGENSLGQLGDNTTISKLTPVSVLGAVKTFCEISSKGYSVLAIDKNGRAWGWGYNASGQLGDGTVTCRSTPVSVAGSIKTFCKISCFASTVAIDKNGRAWAWGYNFFGQLGDNTTISKLTPVSVLGAIKTFCEISAGNVHSLAIDKNGRAWGWGYNLYGQLGDNTKVSKRTPVSVLGAIKTFCKIDTGQRHSLALDKNGRAWAWGQNFRGQLGDNSVTEQLTPVSVAGTIKTFCEISAGVEYSIAIDKNGRAWGWGNTYSGTLGNNESRFRWTPMSVVGAIKTFCKINSIQHSVAIDKNGQIWSWGFNSNGQLGDNTTVSKSTPVAISGTAKTFCIISTNKYTSGTILAIDKNGRAWGWGTNNSGEIGDNTTTSQLTPVSVLGAVKTFCGIAAGYSHSAAIDKNGKIWTWGSSLRGELGDNTTVSKFTPVSILGATKTFCKITAAGYSTHAIDKNGLVWGWGLNSTGQIGDGTTTSRLTPVSVAGATKTFCEISATKGQIFGRINMITVVLGLDKNGRAWGWGNNAFGQIGDNSTTLRTTPVSVAGAVKTFCKISGGTQHVLAIDKTGRAWGWGRNTDGQIGDGTDTSRLTPVSVLGAIKTFCEISAGNVHSLAIDKNGRAWAWGYVSYGAVGIPYASSILTPVRVCNI